MSELCRFHGISIRMHFGDHPPPHFHVAYSGVVSRIDLDGLVEVRPSLPRPVLRRIKRWASVHRAELWTAWERASRDLPLGRIDP